MTFQITSNVISVLDSSNADLYVNDIKLVLGDSIAPNDVVVAKAHTGYAFTVDGVGRANIYFSGNDGMGGTLRLNFVLNENKTVGEVVYNPPMFGDYQTIVAITEQAQVVSGFQVDSNVIDILEAANADLYVNDTKLVLDDVINPNDTVVAKAHEGYVFTVDSLNRANIYFSFSDGMGGTTKLWFELNENKTVGEVVYQQVAFNTDYQTLVAITEQAPVEVLGANNVYLIDSADLATINNDRFVADGLGEVRDYGSFILSVLELPFEVPSNYLLDSEPVQLATLQTSVNAPKLNNDVITVNMGNITVPPIENNLLDYANTVITLRLPRADAVIIDSEYVIGETVSIEYLIDCYTGIATINVSSTKVNGVVLTLEVDLGINVPYASESRNPTANNINVVVGGDNGVTIPYIEVARNDAILPYGFFTVPIIDEGVLSSHNGFIKVEEIMLGLSANSAEYREIVNLLKSGVIIRE